MLALRVDDSSVYLYIVPLLVKCTDEHVCTRGLFRLAYATGENDHRLALHLLQLSCTCIH
jgi:hypothetical protein